MIEVSNSIPPEAWRLPIFMGLLLVFIGLETLFPAKARTQPRSRRWLTNMGIVIIDTVIVRLMGPLIAVAVAAFAASKGWGVLAWFELPLALEIIIAVILLDLSIYVQHVVFHRVPLFWRMHKVHHADRDIDVTTALRFHPVEIVLSMLYKGLIVLLLGPAVIAVILFEIILNGMAMFNHANLRLPKAVDKILRIFVVTPDMHRVHHSVLPAETHCNFGFNLSIWDRVFKTYKNQPKAGHDRMLIGLPEYQTERPSRLFWSLSLPFKR